MISNQAPTRSLSLLLFSAFLFHAVFSISIQGQDDQIGSQWNQWRGPFSTGVAPAGTPPITWSEDNNIAWKTKLSGLGHSSPVIWNNRIYLTTAIAQGEKFPPRPDLAPGAHDNKRVDSSYDFVGLAIDRTDGAILWAKTLRTGIPAEGAHQSASLASASPVTDGKHVFFSFGSMGLYCVSPAGELVWEKRLGQMQTKHGHGEGSSPALCDQTIIVNWDHEGQSYIMALDTQTGQEKWKFDRPEVTSWSSPIVISVDGKRQVVVAGTSRVRGYDFLTGRELWQCGGLSANVVATPVYADGMLFVGSSYDTRRIMGIRLSGARGDITSTDSVVWSRTQRTPYVPSPVLVDGYLYFLRHYQGIITRLNAKTGDEPTGPFRLAGLGDIYASPVAADGRIYVTGRNGNTLVMTTAAEPEILSLNRLNDSFSASAAIANDELLLRGEKHLYCIRQKNQQDK